MAKKKQGDGSVFQRKDGRWEGRIVVGYKENGYAQTKKCDGAHQDRVSGKVGETAGGMRQAERENQAGYAVRGLD